MAETPHTPDAPFRSGITGKYKLLIKDVTPKFGSYEYDLVDAEGREYKAAAKEHYAEDQLLRCMVSFKVVNARLLVSDVAVCKKQDLATLIPEPPKPEPKPEPKKETKPKKEPPLGDPIKEKISGIYNMRVVQVEEIDGKYSYRVEDAVGRKNKVKTKIKRFYPEGSVVSCSVRVLLSKGGYTVKISSISKHVLTKAASKHSKGPKRNTYHSHDSWLGSPCVGDHFHLIYTPMGNKR